MQLGHARMNRTAPELASVRTQQPIVSAPPEEEHRVLQFRPRPGSPITQHGNNSPAVHKLEVASDLSRYERDREEVDDYRHRMLANVAAFAFTIALLAIGIWLTIRKIGCFVPPIGRHGHGPRPLNSTRRSDIRAFNSGWWTGLLRIPATAVPPYGI
jgi:hypothetical protein